PCYVYSFPTRLSSDLARILLRSLQANVEKEHIPAGLYLLAGIVYPAAVVLQRIQTAEIPGHAHPRHVIGVEFIFQHIQSRIAVRSEEHTSELQSRFVL